MQTIYVIAPDENGPSKIGVSADVDWRIRQLQGGCWLPLRAYFIGYALRIDNSRWGRRGASSLRGTAVELERMVLQTLRDMDLGLHGEWVDVTPEEAEAVIRKCVEKSGAKIMTPQQMLEASLPRVARGDDVVAMVDVVTNIHYHAKVMENGGKPLPGHTGPLFSARMQ